MRKIIDDGAMITTLTSKQLVEEYNARAFELDEQQVNRFATRADGERRVLAINERFNIANAKNKPETPAAPEKPEQRVEAPAAPTPPATQKTPRWARAKREAPGSVAYLPRPGTTQARLYDLLTQDGGVTMDDFVTTMNAELKPGVSPWTTSNTWGTLRYLFCATRGYGLEFDGTRLKLLRPKNEKPAAKAK